MDKRHERDEVLAPPTAAEGVRIIPADEAQAALDAGAAAGRQPEDAPRFGDVPAPPAGPRSPHRFPLPASVDPASAVPRPPVRPGQRRTGRAGGARTREPLGTPAAPRVVRLVPSTPQSDAGATETYGIAATAADEGALGRSERDSGRRASTGGAHFAAPGSTPPAPVDPSTRAPVRRTAEPGRDADDGTSPRYRPTQIFASTAGPPPPGPAGPPPPGPAGPAGAAGPSDPSREPLGPPPAQPRPAPPPPVVPVPDLALPEEGITMHSGSSPELPHWTDPPTGEVPRILPDRELAPDEELSAWQALGSRGLRWRDEASDWDDMSDVSELADDQTRLGALDTTRTEHSDMFSFDEQFDRLEDERSGQHVALEPDLEAAPPAAAAPATPRAQPARAPGGPRRPGRRVGNGNGPGSGNGRGNGGPVGRGPGRSGPSGGRDLATAAAVGGGLLVVMLAAYAVGPAALVLLATLVATASALELYNLIQHRGFRPATLLGLAATVAVMLAAYWRGEQALPLILALVFITSVLWYMLGVVDARPVVNIGLTMMSFVWIGVFGSYASLILRVHHGKSILLLAILATVTADTVAYFAGSSIGQRPLAPAISPGKTWEGALAGGGAAVVLSVIVAKLFLSNTWNIKQAFVLGVVVSVMGPIGDLCESMVKRDLDLKDSGGLLPGHGGLLDRFDALFFVLPAAYYLAQYLKLH